MKKCLVYALLLLLCATAQAEVWKLVNVNSKHYLALSGQVGYFALLNNK